jgi:excisionase family DNA binding protein
MATRRKQLPRLLTVTEAAERLSVSRRTVFTWIALGRLKALHLGRRTTRIEEAEIARFLSVSGR